MHWAHPQKYCSEGMVVPIDSRNQSCWRYTKILSDDLLWFRDIICIPEAASAHKPSQSSLFSVTCWINADHVERKISGQYINSFELCMKFCLLSPLYCFLPTKSFFSLIISPFIHFNRYVSTCFMIGTRPRKTCGHSSE